MAEVATSADQQHADEHLGHVMAPQTLVTVFVALLGLTLLTVVAAEFSFGAWEIWVSLGIASVKAALVAIYFMHLRHDRPFHAIVLLSSLLFVALFVAFTLMDLHT